MVENKGPQRRILVFRTGHLGDTIVALQAFWAIRKSAPEARITFLTNESKDPGTRVPSLAVLPEKGLFDSYLSYPSRESGGAVKLRMLNLAAKIRLGNYDSVAYLMTRSRTAEQISRDESFFRLCGIGTALGTDFLRSALLPEGAGAPLPKVEPEGDFLLSLVRDSGFDVPVEEVSRGRVLALTEEELERGRSWLRSNVPGEFAGSRLVGLGPGSKWESKVWPEERFAEVVSKLAEERNVFPIVLGGPEDELKGRRLIRSWGRGACAAGDLGVRDAASVLANCSLYLGNDTGTMHLAAAAGARCVAVFAAVDYPGRWEPAGSGHRVFRVKVPCEGCHTPDCFNEHQCLTSISVKEVLEACLETLDAAEE